MTAERLASMPFMLLNTNLDRSYTQDRLENMPGISPLFDATGGERFKHLIDQVRQHGIFTRPTGAPLLLNCFIALENLDAVRLLIQSVPDVVLEGDVHG